MIILYDLGKTSSVQELYHTVRGVTVLNLKVQELQLQLESHAVTRDYSNAYSIALHQD